MNDDSRWNHAMRFDRYVLFMTYSDYRFGVAGLERYLRDEMEMLKRRRTSSLCLFPFPTKRSQWMDGYLSRFWGVLIDGKLVGFYGLREGLGIVAELGRGGHRLLEMQIHHLLHFKLENIARLFSEFPVAVKLFLHDYYTVCPQFNLMKNGERFCGEAMPAQRKCSGCTRWTPEHHGNIRSVLECVRDRLTVVAPSASARRIWLSTFPDFAARTVVVPHLKREGEAVNAFVKKNEGDPIRLAHVGAPSRVKGWDVFRQLSRDLAAESLNYEFYHLGLAGREERSIQNIPVSFVADGPEAMTAALRKADIDIVLLWALWPETYSYTMYESLMANAMLITNSESGNIADTIASQGLGPVFGHYGELLDYARDVERVRKDVEGHRGRSNRLPTRMAPNDEILDGIDFNAETSVPCDGRPVRNEPCVTALYRLKLIKKSIAKQLRAWRRT